MLGEGQTALITGATGTIGGAIASQLANRQVRVILVGRISATLESVAGTLSGRASCCQADLSSDADIEALGRQVRENVGRLDVLVHCAGAIATGPVEHAPVDDFDLQYRMNVRAPYLLTQTLLPMLKSAQGQIVFLNSSLWRSTRINVSQYAATKYALKAVADSLRDEVNADSIRVLSVFPGRTAGPTQEAKYLKSNKPYDSDSLIQPADIATMVVAALALPRTAEVTEITIRPLRKPPHRED